jgi:hypothetical protein
MHLPIGISDFRKLVTEKTPSTGGYLFIDKTSFIKEILDDLTEVIVITRPRRFGKTLNLSMLQYFYASIVDDKPTKGLFDGLEISKHAECMQQQGKYPVIFISFKDVKQPTFELCIRKTKAVIAETYRKYRRELFSDRIAKDDRLYIDSILEQKSDRIDIEDSIKRLLVLLCQYYKEKPILLIDEYDTPIQEAYLRGYYDELMPFFRNFLSGPLKDESLLKRAILTGILRISKESLFSGISNIKIHSVSSDKYSNHFGFTENEVNILLNKAKLPAVLQQTKDWYNGYNFGGTTIYNPWSIIEFIFEKGKLRPYWVNTSDNELIKQLIVNSGTEIKDKIATLIAGKSIKEIIDEHIVFGDLDTNPSALWNLFLMSGYLKAIPINKDKNNEDNEEYELSIPNKEIDSLYRKIIREWLSGARGLNWYREFLSDLANGRVEAFEEKLQALIIGTLSCHDVTIATQEAFYHGLMLGFVSGLKETHEIKSNKESGKGFYDVAIIPKDVGKLGIVMEFKATDKENNLDNEAKIALEQIDRSNYIAELNQRGITNICKMGIAFARKVVRIATR